MFACIVQRSLRMISVHIILSVEFLLIHFFLFCFLSFLLLHYIQMLLHIIFIYLMISFRFLVLQIPHMFQRLNHYLAFSFSFLLLYFSLFWLPHHFMLVLFGKLEFHCSLSINLHLVNIIKVFFFKCCYTGTLRILTCRFGSIHRTVPFACILILFFLSYLSFIKISKSLIKYASIFFLK